MPLNLVKNMTLLFYTKKDHLYINNWCYGIRDWNGNTLIMERVFLYLGGAVVEPKGIIKHIVAKIDTKKE
ncbi:hypothetical protein [Spiroplasma endosymbiont of Polydrusus formosus]|uniref:hypothetical protein n=1 Tax=Spiroplasma endosymbiont of Polydrusus formosus TaxID=3139326 RepID=UPI0035B510A4